MLAPRMLQRELNHYSKDNIRYVPTIEESLERLRNATHQQAVELYRDYLGSQSGVLTIVGDFNPQACLPLLKQTLAACTVAKPSAPLPPPLTTPPSPSHPP